MPLTNVLSVDVRPEKRRGYLELCHELEESAKNKNEAFTWSVYETRIGQPSRLHFVTRAADFAELDRRGTPEEMFARILGEKRALERMSEAFACAERQQQEISLDRAKLRTRRHGGDAGRCDRHGRRRGPASRTRAKS